MVLMKLTIPFRRRFLDVNRGVAVHFEFCKLIVLNVPIFIALHRYNKKPHQDKQGVLFVRCHGNNSPQYVVTDPCKRKESPKNENGIQIEAVLTPFPRCKNAPTETLVCTLQKWEYLHIKLRVRRSKVR